MSHWAWWAGLNPRRIISLMLHNPPTCICFCFDWWRAAFKMASISDSGLNGSALSKILLSHIFYTIWDRPDKSWELCRLSFSGWSIGFKDRFFHRDERWENLPKILFSLTAMQRSICYQPWAPKQALYIRLPLANINISHMHDKGPNRVTSLNESIFFHQSETITRRQYAADVRVIFE